MEAVENYTQDQFVPFAPRHVMSASVLPGTDASLQFPDTVASQQATDVYSDVRRCSSQQCDYKLEFAKNAIDMKLQDILSSFVPTVVSANITSSCNAPVRDEDESSQDNASNTDITSDSEGNVTDSSADSDLSTSCSMTEADTSNATEQTSCHSLDSSITRKSATTRVSIEHWLTNNNIPKPHSNACITKKRNFNSGRSADSSVDQNTPCSRSTSKSKVQFDQPDVSTDHASDHQSVRSQSLSRKDSTVSGCSCQSTKTKSQRSKRSCKKASATSICSHHSADDTQGRHQSAKRKSPHPCKTSGASRQKNKKTKTVIKQARAKRWQVRNVSERLCLFEYKSQLLNQQIPFHSANLLQQAYCCIGERWGMTVVRHVRGDHYSAVRAILYQALVNNFLHENSIGKFKHSCRKLHVFGDARNKFLECWNFANRIPYEEGRVVEVLSHCLEEFHGVIETMAILPSHECREDYLMCLLNHNPAVDVRLLESVKFLMMERAVCIFRQMEWRKLSNYPQPAEFWLFSSMCPEQLFRQRINPLGDSVKAGPMEFQLLGYTLGIHIEIIRPSMFCTCDFITRFMCEGVECSENVCVVIKDGNGYCVLTS